MIKLSDTYFKTLNKLEHMDRKNRFLNKDRKQKTHLIKHWHLAFSHVKQFKEAKKQKQKQKKSFLKNS